MSKRLPSDRCSAQSAFTLIELLVVISIIGMLVGILLPALGKARLAAQQVVGQSNQRQIGIGMLSYAADNNGYAPGGPMQDHLTIPTNNKLWPGTQIWGKRAHGENGPLGIGVLYSPGEDANVHPDATFGNYLDVALAWPPTIVFHPRRSETQEFFQAREYFGNRLEPVPSNGRWDENYVWSNSANGMFYFHSGFTYRGRDRHVWNGLTGNGSQLAGSGGIRPWEYREGENLQNVHEDAPNGLSNVLTENTAWTEHVVLADNSGWAPGVWNTAFDPQMAMPLGGACSVLIGDGSVTLALDPGWATWDYVGHPGTYPSYLPGTPIFADNHNYIFRTLQFDRCDEFLGLR